MMQRGELRVQTTLSFVQALIKSSIHGKHGAAFSYHTENILQKQNTVWKTEARVTKAYSDVSSSVKGHI